MLLRYGRTKMIMSLKNSTRALSALLLMLATSVFAGPFSQYALNPFSLTGGAPPSVSLTEMEPSAVVIFAPTEAGFAALDSFMKWVGEAPQSVQCLKFGLVVLGPDDQPEIVTEALIQRKVMLPMFWTTKEKSGDLLANGVHGRVVVVSGGNAEGTTFEGLTDAVTKAISTPVQPKAAATPTTALLAETSATTSTSAVNPTTSATKQTGLYVNKRFTMSVTFPKGIGWRESRNGDGAIGQSLDQPNSKLVWRIWGAPNTTDKNGDPGQMTALEYVRRLITVTASRVGTQPKFEKRFEVHEGLSVGRDYSYSITPENSAKVLGRVQAFESGNLIKAVSVEGPAEEFQAQSDAINSFFESFSTQAQLPDDLTRVSSSTDQTTSAYNAENANNNEQPLLYPPNSGPYQQQQRFMPPVNHFPQETIPLY